MNEHEGALLASVENRRFIGGEWVDAAGGATFEVRDPATGEVIRSVADATAQDGIRALDAAVAATAAAIILDQVAPIPADGEERQLIEPEVG